MRPAQQFVAAKRHHIGPAGNGVGHGHFGRQAVGGHINQGAAAQVHHHRQAGSVGQGGHIGIGHAGGKALNGVVAGVDLHQQGGVLADGPRVVVGVGAVGGAHLDQAAAGLGHDVRDAKRTANFHQLAARNHHFAPGGQCAQGEQHGGGVVVHDGGGLGPGELADQVGYQVIAVAPAAVLQVVFQVHWAGHGLGHALHHLLRQQGAAQVGVQHGAGEVEHGFQARRVVVL